MRILIRNGTLVDPTENMVKEGDLAIAEGRIAALGHVPQDFAADHVIDAKGLIVAPGLLDLSARLREPGFEYRATLESELAAAVAGGVTGLACPPDTEPPLDEPGLVEMLIRRSVSLRLSHVYPVGALTQGLGGKKLTEMAELFEAGCIAFSQDDKPFADLSVLMRAMQYAATFGLRVWLRAQDPGLARGGVAHDGEVATRLGLPAIPAAAETVALSAILLLMKETGARVHICRVSAAESVAMIRRAKQEGLDVTCDVGAHYLHFSELDIGYFDSNCRMSPPLRSLRDRDALAAGVADGTIDAICSDHTPVDEDGKQVPFGEAEPGATGLELLLPLVLKWGSDGKSLPQTLAPVVTGPAKVLGLEPSRLRPGATADLVVFNKDEWWRVESSSLRSQGKNTPISGYEVQGRVRYTLVGGAIVYHSD